MEIPKPTPISKSIPISKPNPIPEPILISKPIPQAIMIPKPILESIPETDSGPTIQNRFQKTLNRAGIDSDETSFVPTLLSTA